MRPGLEACGAEILLHGVALQPGKPLLFGYPDWNVDHNVEVLRGYASGSAA